MTKSFKELLDEALVEARKSKSDLGRDFMGRKSNPYQGYYDLVNPEKRQLRVTPELLDLLCAWLGKPKGHFGDPDTSASRAAYIRRTFAEFLATDIARETPPDILEIIEHIPFNGQKLPTKDLYQAIAIAMRGGKYTASELLHAVEFNESLASVPLPAKKRRKRNP
jgi:hypothetical protein